MNWYEDPVYIKMRIAAIPDLGSCTDYEGDAIYDISFEESNYLEIDGYNYNIRNKMDGWDSLYFISKKVDGEYLVICRLERQDQLQGMSGLTWHYFDLLCWSVIWNDDGTKLEKPFKEVPSKEIASLMAVMYELHNKIWDGDKWIAVAPSV